MTDREFIKAIKEKMTIDYNLLHKRKDKTQKKMGRKKLCIIYSRSLGYTKIFITMSHFPFMKT